MKRELIVLVILTFYVISFSAQKMIVLEKFTNSSCGACADAALHIEDLVEEFPNIIWVSHQKTHGWRDNPLANEDSWTIWQEVNQIGNPTAMIDRQIYNNRLVTTRGSWRDQIVQQLQQPQSAQVDIVDIDFDPGTRILDFRVKVRFLEPVEDIPLRMTAMMVQDSTYGEPQDNYNNNTPGHPHEGRGAEMWDYAHRNVVRAILDNPWGSDNFFPRNPIVGEIYSKSYSYAIPEDRRADRHKIVTFVSQHGSDLSERRIMDGFQIRLDTINLTLTSISTNITERDFKVSPNPTSDFIEITEIRDFHSLRILDISGKEVFYRYVDNDSEVIDVSALYEGVYFVQMLSDDGIRTQKFIISR